MAKEVKLSSLGEEMETFIKKLMKEVQKPQENLPAEERYSLTDKMKVLDRALKWEAIKQKADDDEGGFFNFGDDKDDDDAPSDGRKVKKGQSSGRGHFGQ